MTDQSKQDFASVQGAMTRGAAWMVAMRWSLRGVGLINTIIIARLLTPSDFGISTMAWLVVEFLMMLSETNVDMALLRANTFSRDYMDTAFTVRVLAGTITTLALFAAAPLAARYYGDARVVDVIRVVALRAVIMGFENIGVVDFRHRLEFSKEYRYWLWRRLLMLGFGLGLAFTLRSYWALTLAAPASGLVTVGLSFTMSRYRPRFRLVHWRELWKFSQWVILYSTARFFNGRVDQIIIGGIGTAADIGNYGVAYDTSAMPTREIIWPMGRAFTPTLARIVHDKTEMKKALKVILGVVAMLALPAGIGMSAVAEDTTLVLLGNQWTESVEFFRWLAICGAGESWFLAMESYFIAYSHERTFAWLNVAGLVVLVPAVAAAGHVYGLHAVAGVRTIITLAMVGMMFAAMVRLGWLRWRDAVAVTWRPLVAALAMGAAVTILHDPRIPGRLLSLAHDIAIGIVTFSVFLAALWLLSGRPEGTERAMLNIAAGLRRRIGR